MYVSVSWLYVCESVMFECVSVYIHVYIFIYKWIGVRGCVSEWACMCTKAYKGKWKEKDYKRRHIANVHKQAKSRNLILKDYEAERACIETVTLIVPSGKFIT